MAEKHNTTDNRRKLYDVLQQHVGNMGTWDEFNRRMDDEGNRRKVYEVAQQRVANIGSWDEFNARIYQAPAPATPKQEPQNAATPAVEPQAAAATPAQPRWQPTEQDKIRMQWEMFQSMNGFKQRTKARLDRTRRMAERFTPEGRRKLKAAKFAAQAAGAPTKVMGITPPAQAPAGAQAGGQAGAPPVQSGESPVPYGVKYIDGKPVTEWLLPDGSLTTSLLEADQAEFGARKARLRHQFEKRMKSNGLNPANPDDVELQAQYDAQAPAFDVVADLWSEAEELHKKDRERNADRAWDSYAAMGGGRELRVVTASMNRHADNISHLTRFDLQKMMDKAWERVGPQIYANCYSRLKQQYPGASAQDLHKTATEMARSLSDNAVYQYAIDKNTPKSTMEFFGRTVADMNLINSLGKALARSQAGTSGDMAAYDAATAEYAKHHRVAQVGGTVVGMAIDPVTWISGGVGSAAGKGALWTGGRIMARFTGTTGQVATRYLGTTLTGRLLGGMAGGAANLGTYEALKEGERQLKYGGYINPETGKNEGYSPEAIWKQSKHGAGMGVLIGWVGPVAGNVFDPMVKSASSIGGKIALRGGEQASSALFEGTIFAAPDYISMRSMSDEDFDKQYAREYGYASLTDPVAKAKARSAARSSVGWDIWNDSMAMMLGFKAQHGIKSAWRTVRDMAPYDPEKLGRPLSMQEKAHNRQSFQENLRKALDKSPADIAMSKEELEELRNAGYGKLASLFHENDYSVKEVGPDGQERVVGEAEQVEIQYGPDEETVESVKKSDFDGYDTMARLMQDSNVSEAVRAKAYFILTGRRLPESTIMGFRIVEGENDGVYVQSLSGQGSVVTNRHFSSRAKAQQEITNLDRQIELNSIEIGEKFKTKEILSNATQAGCEDVAAAHGEGWTAEGVRKAYEQAVKDLADPEKAQSVGQATKDLVKEVEAAANKHVDDFKGDTPDAIRERINYISGVDLDEVIRKERSKRTDKEQAALEAYLKALYPEEARQGETVDGEAPEEPAPSQGQATVQEAREAGYNMTDQGQREQAMRNIRYQEKRMEEMFGRTDTDAMFEEELGTSDPAEILDFLDQSRYDATERAAIVDYLKACQVGDAAVERMEDDTRNAMERENAFIDKVSHEDGFVRPATMKVDSRQVYIVGGNVVLSDDGSLINTAASDRVIYIYDPATDKVEQTAPEMLSSLGTATSVEETRAAAERTITEQHENDVRTIQGDIMAFNPGDTFVADVFGDGPKQNRVTGIDENGMIIFESEGRDGVFGLMPDLLSAMVDSYKQEAFEAEMRQQAEAAPVVDERAIVRPGEAPAEPEAEPAPAEPAPLAPVSIKYDQGDSFRVAVSGREETQQAAVVDREGETVTIWTPFPVTDSSEKGRTMSGYTTDISRTDLDAIVARDEQGKPLDYVVANPEGEPSETPAGPEEAVIREGITGTADALKESFTVERERIGNEWLDTPAVQDAMRTYADGASTVEEIVERAKADSNDERTRQRLDTLLEFDSTRQKLQAMLDVPKTGETVPTSAEIPQNPTESPVSGADTVPTGQEAQAAAVEPMPMREVKEKGETWEEPDYLATTPQRTHSYIYNESGLPRQEANDHVNHMARTAKEAVDKHKKSAPKIGGSIARYQKEKTEWENAGVELQRAVEFWDEVKAEQKKVTDAERAALEAQQAQAHDEAVARFEQDQIIKAQKKAEQDAIGTNAVNPKLKAKWDAAPKIVGNANAHVLADGSNITGHYVLTEAGAASASHDPNNAFAPTEGFPIDENGQNVNDRDYERDKDAQRMVENMGAAFDSRALQTPVIVSQDGIVLSGNNRTMSGDLAAAQGTDKAYVDHLTQYGSMYGFTPEQVASMKHPRVVFVPDEALPYDSTTFSRFNAQEMKSQSKPEAAVKLGKIVPDAVFNSIVGDINRYERMSDFYANESAAASALGALHAAGVINDAQMPELRTGTALSAAGKELLENTLIGKVFQSDPDAVRKIMEIPSMRQTIVMALAEIANNRALAAKDYDLVDELSKAVDLCYRAKASNPDVYVPGIPVSPFGRMAGLFDDEFGDSRVTDATTLLLADLLNDTKPSRLRNVLTVYNKQGAEAASGAMDLFTGEVASKETILTEINNHFINATPKEQQAIVDAAIAERRAAAEEAAAVTTTEGSGEGGQRPEQAPAPVQRSEGDGGTAVEPEPIPGEPTPEPAPVVSQEEPRAPEEPQHLGIDNLPSQEDLAKLSYDEVGQTAADYDAAIEERYDAMIEPLESEKAILENKRRTTAEGKRLKAIDKEIADIERQQEEERMKVGKYFTEELRRRWKNGEHSMTRQELEQDLFMDEAEALKTETAEKIAAAEAEVNTEPTEAQKKAGNYKMGHVKIDGMEISIENPKGSMRRGKEPDGTPWENEMKNTYGYIKGTTGVDGDKIDVFLSDNPTDGDVYVVDQYNKDGSFDEHKVMYGFTSATEAEAAYLSNYSADWAKGRKVVVTGVTREEFKKWLDASDRKKKPFAEYKSVKPIETQDTPIQAEAPAEPAEATEGYDLDVYETKKGKKFHRVKFPRADKEVWKERLDIAKEQFGGTSVPGGYGFKDAETAKAFAEAILHPVSAEGLKERTDAMAAVEDFPDKVVNEDAVMDMPDDTAADLHIVDVLNPGMTEHSPKEAAANLAVALKKVSDAKLLELLKEHKDNKTVRSILTDEYNRRGGVSPEAVEAARKKPASRKKSTPKKKPEPEPAQAETQAEAEPQPEAEKKARSKWFNEEDQDEAADLIRKMKARLRGGNLYSGIPIDVELLELGCRLGYLIMKKGARKLHEYAQAMIENVGDGIRPYIKQFYNATLATEEALAGEWYKDATPMAEIAKFDMVNFLKEQKPDVVETARGVSAEQEVQAAMPQAATDMVKKSRDKMAIPGYFKPDGSVSAETKAAQAGADLAAALVDELGLDLKNLPEGVQVITTDFNESGGNIRINLPIRAGYEPIKVDIDFDKTEEGALRLRELTTTMKRGDDLSYIIGEDHQAWLVAPGHKELLNAIRGQIKDYLPKATAEAKPETKKPAPQPSLFDEPEAPAASAAPEPQAKTGDKLLMQYEAMKKKHPDAVVLFRVGDFYETFHDDARIISETLGLTLTTRGGDKIPLAGFPHHALDAYLPKLVRAGKRIAICEQLEEPKISKQTVKRGTTPQPATEPKAPATSQAEFDELAKNEFEVDPQVDKEIIADRNGFKIGDTVEWSIPGQGKTSATIIDVDRDGRPILDTGMAPIISSIAEWKDLTRKNGEGSQPPAPQRPKSELSGDSAKEQDLRNVEHDFVEAVSNELIQRINNDGSPLTMAEVRKMAEERGLKDVTPTDLQELVERAVSLRARSIAEHTLTGGPGTQEIGFNKIVKLYTTQPVLSDRDVERIQRQQYSTPVPMGYLMDQFMMSHGHKGKRLLEPSAGNGALTIGVPKDNCHVNDIDPRRLANLRAMGFKVITNQDALQPFDGRYDLVVTNPPFGTAPAPRTYDGLFEITTLEGQMAINALESMTDDGRAAIIVGGSIGKWPTPYEKNGRLQKVADRQFFGYLYSHYNVVDIIPIDGKSLYSRNGTGYNVRMILIDGRRRDAEGNVIREVNAENRVFPPVKEEARPEAVTTYDELYKRVQDDILRIQQRLDVAPRNDGGHIEGDGAVNPSDAPMANPAGDRGGERPVGTGNSSRTPRSGLGGTASGSTSSQGGIYGRSGRNRGTIGQTDADAGSGDGSTLDERPGAGGLQTELRAVEHVDRSGDRGGIRHGATDADGGSRGNNADGARQRSGSGSVRLNQPKPVKVELTDEKVASPHVSSSANLMSRMPAAQAQEFERALHELEEKHGNVDEWLTQELGYADTADLYRALAAEQVEGVAMAIDKMNSGRGFIIADQTGIGKGRQAASIIRYAVRNGHKPIFFTQKAGLFSDMYRDLKDIGCPDLKPFIFGSDKDEASITERQDDGTDKVIYPLPKPKERDRVLSYIEKHGTLPDEYDYAVITYSQVQNGTTQYEIGDNGKIEAKPKTKKGKGASSGEINGERRRHVIDLLSRGNYLILDEAHTAGGQSGLGGYMQSIIPGVKGITYLSATYAKRPDNMPLYAIKTAISDSGVEVAELISAVAQGGVPLQEIMSRQLVKSGEMARRERDFTGVTIDWIPTDEGVAREQQKRFDTVSEIFVDIMRFQDTYVRPYLNDMSKDLARIGSSSGQKKGTKDMGIGNAPFASKLYNLLQQLLFSIKVDAVADRAIKNLQNGRKPIISFVNTMEGFLEEAGAGMTEDGSASMPTLSLALRKALDGVMRYTVKDDNNNETHSALTASQLGPDAESAYNAIIEKMNAVSDDLPIAPLDAIRLKIEAAGYKVGELSGRKLELAKNDKGLYVIRNRKAADKKATAADFNAGKIDVLMVNKTGSTGISLHASSKFEDQRQRVMIAAQFQPDVNDEVQMRGRNDRTGQVVRGAYEYLLSSIPAEQRLQMMFKAKLKSLDANTTSSQKSSFNEMEVVDVLNKYGDAIVWDYLNEDPMGLNMDMGNPLGIDPNTDVETQQQEAAKKNRNNDDDDGTHSGFARKALGRLALLSIAEQERVMSEITDRYEKKIHELDERGENDLEISYRDLKAKTLGRKVWVEGKAPGSGNAFADNVYMEQVEVNILDKPLSGTELAKYHRTFLEDAGVETWDEWLEKKTAEIDAFYENRIATVRERITANKEATIARRIERFIATAKDARALGKNSFTDEEITAEANRRYGETERQEAKAEIERETEKIRIQQNLIKRRLTQFKPMSPLSIPDDLTDESKMNLEPSTGVMVGIKLDSKYSLNGSQVVFAPLDGRRTITLSLKEAGVAFSKIGQASMMMRDVLRNFDLSQWDSHISNESRETRYMLTGNILRALVDMQKTQNARGRITAYTTEDGEVRTGILMSPKFTPGDLQSSAPLSSMLSKIQAGQEVKSSNGEVTVRKTQSWSSRGDYEILVPKSKKHGGKYFLPEQDPVLARYVVGGFEMPRSGSQAIGYIRAENLARVLDHLSTKHGASVMLSSKLKDATQDNIEYRTPEEGIEYVNARAIQPWSAPLDHLRFKRDEMGYSLSLSERQQVRDLGAQEKAWEEKWAAEHTDTDVPTGRRSRFEFYADQYGQSGLSSELYHAKREIGSLYDSNYRLISANARDMARRAIPAIMRRRADLLAERPSFSRAGQAAIDAELADLEYMTLYYQRMEAGEDVERTMPGRLEHQRMLATAREVAESLGEKVVLYEAPGDIHDTDYNRQVRKQRSYGWYNPNDGTIHINVGRHKNAREIVKTALHEIIGHKTIEQIMGPKRFARLIDEIWNHAGRKVRTKIAEIMGKNGWDFREATKEYLGEIAEEVHTKGYETLEAEKKTIWQRVKAKIQDFLNRILEGLKIPARIRLTENDLSYMMWKLYKHKERKAAGKSEEGDIFDKAEEIVRREQWERDGDSLEIAARYGEADETSAENLAHGVDSLRRIALGEEEVKDAMHRNDLAQFSASTGITFVYGKPGDSTRNYKGGYGLAHIGAKHGADTILRVLDAIANGKISRYVEGNKTVIIEKDGYEALLALTRYGNKETWLFTGWDKIDTTGENGKVSANTVSTQANPTFSREDLGAVVDDAKIREFFESAKELPENMSDYLRSEMPEPEYRPRQKPAPRNTIKVYKLVRIKEDRPGEWFPLFIDSAAPLRLGEWLDADSPDLEMLRGREPGQYLVNPQTKEVLTREEVYRRHPELRSMSRGHDTKYPSVDAINYATDNGLRWMEIEETDKAQRRFDGENRRYWNLGINGSGSVSTFSMRPGWHAGSLPTMRQIGKGKNKDLRDDNFVWVEGEVSADVDYQAEAERNPDKDLPDRIPEDGFYMKATNANKTTSQADRVGWYVAGSFKANRFISDAEARQIIDDFNATHPDMDPVAYDYDRESGRTYDPEAGLHFRDGDDMQNMTIEERTLKLSVMLADRHSGDVAVRDAAVEALGKTLGNIRKAMAVQHTYDFNTVRSLGAVADILISSGTFLPEGPGEVKRLYGIMKRGIGHTYTDDAGVEHVTQSEKDYNAAVESLMDLFVSNQLKLSGKFLDEVMKIRGSKVNARGVEVIGDLDVEGQIMVRGMKDYMNMDVQAIHDRIDALDDMIANGTDAISMNAAAEKMGLELAEQYISEVSDRAAQEKIMRDQLRDMKNQWDHTMSGDARKAYTEQKRALRESIRKIMIERADAMRQLASQIGNELRNSIERVKAYREREKQRIEEIWHNANSDMTGRAFNEHGMKKKGLGVKLSNNMLSRLLLAPAATFEQVMRVFGSKSVDGEGYLFDRYVRGWQECRDREWTSTQEVEGILDKKAAEILGKRKARWSDLYALTNKAAGSCEWWDGGQIREHKVTQGNLMYMYMVNKMTDGQVKLRRMCITDDKMLEIERALDPKLKAVADWLQEELLPNLRNKYNEVHMRMFGAPMAEIENYFPLRILANARLEEVEMAGKIDGKYLPKTMTGAIIKRRFNNYALDVLNSDAVSVALDHIREMETWAAFAEYRRDLCTLLSYKHFRNQVKNMSTIYGSGEKFWDKFYDLALLVGGAYQPKTSEFDKVAVNITKLATGACIAIRLNTGLKQLLSYPAFAHDANIFRLFYNLAPWRMRACWKWAIKNMPSFQRRWKSRQAGNDVLRPWKFDWDWTRTELVQKIQRIGITPNAFIDALTVAMGSEAVYQNKLKGYLKDGFSKEEAHRRAIQDAEIIFNLSQQSSELPYLSLLQNDRSYITTSLTNFRSSPMSYLRQSIQSKRELANMVKGKDIQIEFETKKGVREGLTPEQAKARAERKFKHNWVRNLFKSANFDYILPALWAFGITGIWYCIFGNDDEKKKQYAEDAIKRGLFGGFEGLTFGGTMPDFMYGLATGDKPQLDEETSPAMGLITDMANLYSNGKTERAANEMINTMIALGVGVNPQVLEDGIVAGMDFFGEDEKSARDWAMLFMRVLSCPQSQMDQVYFDELGMDAREASRKSPAELAERYATYKARRANFATMWTYDDNRWETEVKAPWRKKFKKEAKTRLEGQSDEHVNESLEGYDAEWSQTGKRLRELSSTPGDAVTRAAKAQEIFNSPEGTRYKLYNDMHPYLDQMIKSWLSAPTAQEAATEAAAIIEYKAKLVEMLDAWNDPEKSRAAGREAMSIVKDWHNRQNPKK